jgi:Zinc-binding
MSRAVRLRSFHGLLPFNLSQFNMNPLFPCSSNASKINRARAEAAKRDAVKPGGGGASGKAERMGAGALNLKCAICLAAFLSTQSKTQLTEHMDSKHPKMTFEQCFPDYGKE